MKAGRPGLEPEEAERVRSAMRELWETRFGSSNVDLGRAIGISGPAVSQILSGGNDPSLQTARAVARLKGVSVWVLFGEEIPPPAADLVVPPLLSATVMELEHRYPNFKAAVPFALAQGCSPEAVERVGGSVHSMPNDPSPMEWYEQIKLEDAILKRAARGLAQDVEREAKQRELDEAKNREMEEATRPKLPKRKR